jgi:hypothetical protein
MAHVAMEPVSHLVKVLAVFGLWITEDTDAVPLKTERPGVSISRSRSPESRVRLGIRQALRPAASLDVRHA